MDLNAYTVFLTAAEEMNFTRAAEKLYMTQQSLSGYIRRLESQYGVQLFQRKPTLRLTPEGEAMVGFARETLRNERELAAHFADISQSCAANLRLGMSRQRSSVFFPGIWSAYHTQYPNISVRLKENITSRLLEGLLNNTVDIMVGVNLPALSSLSITPLVREENLCVMNELLLRQQYPEDWRERLSRYHAEGVELGELRELPFLLFPEDNSIRKVTDSVVRQAHFIPRIAMESNEQTVLMELACYGDGIAVVNPANMYERLRNGRPLPETCHTFRIRNMPANEISVALRADVPIPQYLEALKDAIREEFGYYGKMLGEK